MKNKLYYLGLLSILLVLTGCLFKMMHWPGASVMLIFGISFFSLLFLPLGLISSFKAEQDKNFKWLYVVAFITISYNFISALFKIMHWSGAGFLLSIGILLPFILFLPVYLFYNRKDQEINYRNFVGIMFFFGYLAAISALLSLNVSKDIIDESVNAAKAYEQKEKVCKAQSDFFIEKIYQKTDSLSLSAKNTIGKIRKASTNLDQSLEKMKRDVIVMSDADNRELFSSDGYVDLSSINGKDKNYVGFDASNLESEIDAYRVLLLSSISEKATAEYLDKLLSTKSSEEKPWKISEFSGRNLIALVETLNLIKYKVAVAELEAVSLIYNRV